MLNVIFLTLTVSFVAMMFVNGSIAVSNSKTALRLTALNLMDEQFAEIESLADKGNLSAGNLSFLGVEEDLKTYNLNENFPVEFDILTTVNSTAYENLLEVTVTAKWTYDGRDFEIESGKTVRVRN